MKRILKLFFLLSIQLNAGCHWEFPGQLLTPSRFDVIIKYVYAKHRELNAHVMWPTDSYRCHLDILSKKLSDFNQNNTSHEKTFNSLLDSIKKDGFKSDKSIVTCGQNGVSDGAHRLAACLFYDKKIAIDTKKTSMHFSLTADFFKQNGLDSDYLDAMALEYCRNNSNSYVAMLFPVVGNKLQSNIVSMFNRFGKIIYRKKIQLTLNGVYNFLHMVYDEDVYKKDFEKEFLYKFSGYQRGDGFFDVDIFLLDFQTKSCAKACKAAIRNFLSPGKCKQDEKRSSMHINDHHNETIKLAEGLLNTNGIHFLNYSTNAFRNELNQRLNVLEKVLKEFAVNKECICIDSGSVLAAYGVRNCTDFDLLHHGFDDFIQLISKNDIFGLCHVDDRNIINNHFHSQSINEIIFNPKYYFFYKGFKFVCLEEVAFWKKSKNLKKDKHDLELIANHLSTVGR